MFHKLMKKKIILGMLAVAALAQTSVAQNVQEVTYEEDPAQGYLMNRFRDNWFISAEAGGNVLFSRYGDNRNFFDRIGPAFGIFGGKWFSPVIGVRVGVNFMTTKSLSRTPIYTQPGGDEMVNGYYKQKMNEIGPVGNVMINLTNWIGGYKPGRVWNISAYLGGGAYWSVSKKWEKNASGEWKDKGWQNDNDKILTLHAGIQNDFRISKAVSLFLDLRYSLLEGHRDAEYVTWNRIYGDLQAYVGATYYFPRREWRAPVVPVCPPAEDCSGVKAQLDEANAKISELETQLKACLDRPAPKPVEVQSGSDHLATIYYPIGVSRISRQDGLVLSSLAQVMIANPEQRYTLTGWADNYTGSESVNTRLRNERAEGVKAALVKYGVNPSQLDVTINNGNLCDLGEKCVSLDRAVTIDETK